LRYIRPGHRIGDRVEVLAGVSAGEQIALDPLAAAHIVEKGAGGAP
jgi:multidrug efflux pump subunit AcrA (membrane-fusion protein)